MSRGGGVVKRMARFVPVVVGGGAKWVAGEEASVMRAASKQKTTKHFFFLFSFRPIHLSEHRTTEERITAVGHNSRRRTVIIEEQRRRLGDGTGWWSMARKEGRKDG